MQGKRGNEAESLESAIDVFEVMQIAAGEIDSHGNMLRYWMQDGRLFIEYEDGVVLNYER